MKLFNLQYKAERGNHIKFEISTKVGGGFKHKKIGRERFS